MTRQQELERACAALYGGETDLQRRYAILQDAYFQAHNSGYCDAMAGQLMSGRESAQTDFWMTACRLKHEVAALCDIYRQLLGE